MLGQDMLGQVTSDQYPLCLCNDNDNFYSRKTRDKYSQLYYKIISHPKYETN